MARRTIWWLGLLLLAGLAWSGPGRAAAGEDEVRADVDALLEVLRDPESFRPVGASPSARLGRLLGRGKRAFLKELSGRWEADREAGRRDTALERLILFVHGKAEDGAAISLVHGAVRIGAAPSDGDDVAKMPKFRALVAKGKVLRSVEPEVDALLALANDGLPADWTGAEKTMVAMALGEACAADEAASGRLADAAEKKPDDRELVTALAWTRSERARTFLTDRIKELSHRLRNGDDAALTPLRDALRGLGHVRPSAVGALLSRLDERVQPVAVAAASMDVGLPFALRLGARSDEDAQALSLRLLHALFVDGPRTEAPSHEDLPELVRQLARNLDTPALVDMTAEVAEGAFFPDTRHPVNTTRAAGRSSFTAKGERVGPYPDVHTVLRAFALDVEERRVRFLASGQGEFLADKTGWDKDLLPPQTTKESPEPDRGKSRKTLPLRLTGRIDESELALSVFNTGKKSVWINTVALKHGVGAWTTCTVDGERTYTNLHLELGRFHGRAATTAKSLHELPPGGSWAWSIRLREEHLGADHISVSLIPEIGSTNLPKGELVQAFPEVWVR